MTNLQGWILTGVFILLAGFISLAIWVVIETKKQNKGVK